MTQLALWYAPHPEMNCERSRRVHDKPIYRSKVTWRSERLDQLVPTEAARLYHQNGTKTKGAPALRLFL